MDEKDSEMNEFVPLAKANFLGRDIQISNVGSVESKNSDDRIFSKEGALSPPYGPDLLCKIYEHSNSLRQNIDAYMVNIDCYGHSFDPVIDLDDDDAFDKVRDVIYLERMHEFEQEGDDSEVADYPTDEEVKERMEQIEEEMRLEKSKVDAFFKFCCIDESFISLRKKTRQDKELMGNGYWEVIRNGAGVPVQFTYIPGFTVRMMPLSNEIVDVDINIKRTALSYESMTIKKRFRKYVQVFEGTKVFFKEYEDPRIMSAETGLYYKNEKQLQQDEGVDREEPVSVATELIHFSIHSPRSSYGVPRWIGVMLAVLGSRQSEEVNFLYFENKSVPPLAVLVSGGRLNSDSVKRLEDYIEHKIKGRRNFHKILVIEGVPSSQGALDVASGRMKIEILPLTGSQQSDALFQKYDERNIDKIGMAFRLPRLLRGDIRDFNRATAEAALEFAEMQVFSPEREDFDWFINRKVLSALGIKYWTFVSNSATTRNPLDLTSIITDLVSESIVTPEEARELAKGIFNRDFKKIDEIWTKIPPNLLMKGITPEGEEVDVDGPETDDEPMEEEEEVEVEDKKARLTKRYKRVGRDRKLRRLAKDLIHLREMIKVEEGKDAKNKFDLDREILEVPEEEISEFFEDLTDE
jgi:PBSX family phage portal protein